MSMMTKIFLLVAVSVLVFSSVPVAAVSFRSIPIARATRIEESVIVFEGTVYTILNARGYLLTFEKVDDTHDRVHIEIVDGVRPLYGVYLQWGSFWPVFLDIDSGEDNSYLLGTETGYAEK